MEEQLKVTFANALDIESDEVNDSTSPDTMPDWDSLAHLNLIANLEKNFNIQFTMEEVIEMNTFSKIKQVVSRHVENN